MKNIIYLLIGIFFGIGMFKSGAASWYRIYEMFQFDSFHMYGIIATALSLSIVATVLIKKYKLKDFNKQPIIFINKTKSIPRYLIGGSLFGLGWALAGACPGPMFAILGAGFLPVLFCIAGALIGTWLYGLVQDKLPH